MLIFSTNNDQSTNDIIDWVDYLNKSFFRVNSKDIEENLFLELDNGQEQIKISGINIDTENKFWFRKWGADLDIEKYPFDYRTNLIQEFKQISSYLFFTLQDKEWLNKYTNTENTLIQLAEAKGIGLKIPSSIVTSKKQGVVSFFNKHKNIITKPLISHVYIGDKDEFSKSLTTEVSREDVLNLQDNFFPTLFQENIINTRCAFLI